MPHQNWCLLLLKFICWINWWVITRGSLQSEIRCPCISPNLLASEDTWHALRIRLPAISLYGEDSHASPISNSDFYSVLNLWVIESAHPCGRLRRESHIMGSPPGSGVAF